MKKILNAMLIGFYFVLGLVLTFWWSFEPITYFVKAALK